MNLALALKMVNSMYPEQPHPLTLSCITCFIQASNLQHVKYTRTHFFHCIMFLQASLRAAV